MDKNVSLIAKLLTFFDDTNEYLRIIKAALNGYNTFMSDLKGGASENEQSTE